MRLRRYPLQRGGCEARGRRPGCSAPRPGGAPPGGVRPLLPAPLRPQSPMAAALRDPAQVNAGPPGPSPPSPRRTRKPRASRGRRAPAHVPAAQSPGSRRVRPLGWGSMSDRLGMRLGEGDGRRNLQARRFGGGTDQGLRSSNSSCSWASQGCSVAARKVGHIWKFPGSPVVRILPLLAEGSGSTPGWGTKISRVPPCGQKKRKDHLSHR